MIGLVGANWNTLSDQDQAEILAHEAGHVAGGHSMRVKDRNKTLFNVVCDAAIHYAGVVSPELIARLGLVTFDLLKIPACPPEIAYELLPKNRTGRGGGGCGREEFTEVDSRSRARAILASLRGAAALRGSTAPGTGRSIPETILPRPLWIDTVIRQLQKAVAYDACVRTWWRETRRDVEPLLLPGHGPRYGVAAVILIDSSGSIGNTDLAMFLAAVESTPELWTSQVSIFGNEATELVPIHRAREMITQHGGGGTRFEAAAARRIPGVTAVWLTDGCPNDGWPAPHDAPEIWVLTTDVQPPQSGEVVRTR